MFLAYCLGNFPCFSWNVSFFLVHCEGLPALTNGPHSPEVPEQNRLGERGDWIVCLFVYILEEKATVSKDLCHVLLGCSFTLTSTILSEQRDFPFTLCSV